MRLFPKASLAVLLVLVCGAAKKHSADEPSRPDTIEVRGRSPLRCASYTYDQSKGRLEAGVVGGCDLRPSFYFAKAGWVEMPLPTNRDADVEETWRPMIDDQVLRRRLTLADPSGMQLWTVKVEEDELAWSGSGKCVAPASDAPRTLFDLSAWRFMVVRVTTRGPYGGLRSWEGRGDDEALRILKLAGPDGREVEVRKAVASGQRNGVWVVSWCADAIKTPYTVKLAVTDTSMGTGEEFELPVSAELDTVTLIDLVVAPNAQ